MHEIKLNKTEGEIAIPFEGSIIMRGDTSVPPSPAPVSKAERIQTIDIIRGVALFGILLMNIPGFGIDGSVFYDIIASSSRGVDFYTLSVIMSLFEGTMRGLFSMLFGAGMILFTMNKIETKGNITVAEVYYRRLMWLVLFGLINAYVLLWPGDILFFYGLIGMLLYPLRNTAPRWLLILGLACFAIGMYKTILGHNETREKRAKYHLAMAAEKKKVKLTAEQEGDKNAWLEIEKNRKPDPENTTRNVQKMRSGYGTVFTHILPQNASGEPQGMYHFIWDMLGMMLIGMAFFKLGFFTNRWTSSTYFMLLLLGYGLGIPIGWIIFEQGFVGSIQLGAFIDSYRVPHWVLYDVKRILLAIGHASAIMLIFRSRIVPALMNGMANVGQMAFTNYLMQSIICSLFFYGYGLGNYNKLRFHELYYVVGCIWIFQIFFSVIWLRYFRFGPFEWLWRSLTYWKFQPMKYHQKS